MRNKMKSKYQVKSSRMRHNSKMEKPGQIALVYRKTRIGEQGSDRDYWLSQSLEARLAALEQIRRDYHGWIIGEEPKVERVVSIIRLGSENYP